MGRIMALVGLGARLGVCGGTVYILNDQGVFGNVKQGEAAYTKACALTLTDLVGPEVAEYLPVVELPKEIESGLSTVSTTTKDVTKNFGNYWNCGVNATFSGINTLPDTIQHYSNMAIQEIKKDI